MASLTTRINLTGEYAIAVEQAAKDEGCSQAEIVRKALRAYWGESLERSPSNVNGSPVHPVTRSTVQPSIEAVKTVQTPVLPSADDLFAHSA